MQNIETIYIKLLDEGTTVYRPTKGELISGGSFKVLCTDDYDEEDEKWEFCPGQIVKCKKEIKNGQEVNIAYSLAT